MFIVRGYSTGRFLNLVKLIKFKEVTGWGGYKVMHTYKVLKGTTTVGIRTNEAVVLAADKRASSGYYVAHKTVRKIVKIDDHIAMTISGLVADAQMLSSILRYIARDYKLNTGMPIPVRNIVSYLALLLNSTKYFPYIVQLLVGGYDDSPKLYSVEWFGDFTQEDYAVSGSGSPVAVGVLEAHYRRDMSVEEAVKLAVEAVRASIKRDVFTGEAVDVAVITRDGIKFMSFPR